VFELSWPKIKNIDAELVPAKIFNFEWTDVKEIALNYADRSILLEKTNNVWKLKNNEQKDVQGREVDYFVRNLHELKGDYIEQYKATNLTQFSLDKPHLSITIGLESGNAVLYIGKKKDTNGYYVKNKDSDYVYVVGNESIVNLMKKEEDFTTVVIEPAPKASADEANVMRGEMPAGISPHGRPPSRSPHGGGH
jgi:hypothetical protein